MSTFRILAIGLLGIAACSTTEDSAPPAASSAASTASVITFEQHPDRIDVLAGGKPLTTLYVGSDVPKPYLHPLRAADGQIMTRQYPMRDDVPNEAHDHPHHRGMWFSHGDVNGFDFWANEPDQKPQEKKGKIVLKGAPQVSGDSIRASFEWRSPSGEVLLTDDRVYRFDVTDGNVLIDNKISLTAVDKPVKFGDTKEGTFAIRINEEMRETTHDKQPGKGVITTSTGLTGEKQAWGKAAPWVDYSGPIGGKIYGIAILDHPSSAKHPTFWHVRAYGLFAANIFGEHDFFSDKSRDGSVTLQPGQKLNFDYRVVIHPGDATSADIAKLYSSWTGGASNAAGGNAEAAIQQAEANWAKAVINRDFDALEKIYDDTLIYAHSTGIVETKDQYMAKLRSGKQVYTAIDLEQPTIRVHGNAAVAHHIVVMKGTNATGPFDNKLMMIHTWVNNGGAWKLAAHQTTLLAR